MTQLIPSKRYYSISEVSGYLGIEQHVLRYWETEFSKLHPKKNSAGNRQYRMKDVKLLVFIKKLLYEDKYTLEGARLQMKGAEKVFSPQMELAFDENKQKSILKELAAEIREISTLLK